MANDEKPIDLRNVYDFPSQKRIDSAHLLTDLKTGGGGGNSGDMGDDWKSSVNGQLAQLHGDVRALLNYGIAAVAFLLLAMTAAYLSVNTRLSGIEVEQGKVAERTANIDKRLESMDQKLEKIADKLDKK